MSENHVCSGQDCYFKRTNGVCNEIPEKNQAYHKCEAVVKDEVYYTGYVIKNGIRTIISGTLEECVKKQCEVGVTESHIWIE